METMENIDTFALSKPLDFPVKHNPIKRTFDVVFSSLVLVLTAPLMGLIALLVRFSSRGKIVYAHERIGRGGKPFKCYKFRTMYPDADIRLKEILDSCPIMKNEWDQTHKLKDDPRVTSIGKFLRKTSLDEFPQFWNVLRGDLSVVGPRPVVRYEVIRHIGEKAEKILSIRPGLTGLWQISGRSDTCYATRVKMDEEYVDKRSFFMDLKIIFLTIPRMLFSKGAY